LQAADVLIRALVLEWAKRNATVGDWEFSWLLLGFLGMVLCTSILYIVPFISTSVIVFRGLRLVIGVQSNVLGWKNVRSSQRLMF
jgi:hypothetical protein